MIYVHVATWSKPDLFVAETETEMVEKLKIRFKLKNSKSSNFAELEEEIKGHGRGYHGAADLYFEVVKPN